MSPRPSVGENSTSEEKGGSSLAWPIALKNETLLPWVKAGVARLCWGAKPQDQYNAFLEEQRYYPDV